MNRYWLLSPIFFACWAFLMKSSANFSCWRIDRSIDRIPWRIFISRSIRRSSLLLNNPIFLTLELPVLRRGALSHGLVGLLERLVLFHGAPIQIVPDIHQFLT